MSRRVAALLPYAVFLILTLISWNRWVEPYVDSGRELAVPWRVASGERLYRDVRFFHGPLGPYVAAAVEKLGGRSLPRRFVLAGLIALAHLEILRRLALLSLSAGRAALLTALIVAATFFLRPGGCHLFPFSLDTSIAAASIAGALWFASFDSTARRDGAAGACLAAALLSRPEMGLAAAAALAWQTRLSRRAWRLLGLPLLFSALVYAALSAGTTYETLRLEGWLAILGPPEAFRNIYAAYAGLDRPALRIAELALAAVLLLLVGCWIAGSAAVAARVSESNSRRGLCVEAGSLLFLVLLACAVLRPPDAARETVALLPPLVRVVPIVVLILLLARAVERLRSGLADRGPETIPDAVLIVAALFAVRLLLAAGYVGPYNGFLLPLPLLVAGAALSAAADRLAPRIGPALPRLVAGALAVFLIFRVAALRDAFRSPAWSRVDTPIGAVELTEPVAGATRLALSDLAARVPAGGTLAGFPEVGFFNYVLGRRNPLPQEQFFPGHFDRAEEEATVRRLNENPPDALLFANVVAVGHGSRVFGKDYLALLDRFVRARFAPAASYGPGAGPSPRIGDPQFFLEIRVPRHPPLALSR